VNTAERIQVALELARQASVHIKALGERDPVEGRQQIVFAAEKYQKAADFLDDEGRLGE